MKTRSRELERSGSHQDLHRQAKSNPLARLALLLSILAIGLSGYAAYQVFELKQASDSTESTSEKPAASETSTETNSAANSPATSSSDTASQPGQLVQPALDNKGEITLLAAERIQDPDQGTRDIVNVKLRLRRLAENVSAFDFVNVGGTTARQPGGGDVITYEPVDAIQRSTGPISLEGIRKGASVDAYVWLRVPENVDTIDLYIPQAEPFQAVSIRD